jgi:hypothetical protein
MNIDQLRDEIWNYLFETKDSKTIQEISELSAQDPSMVHAAVSHEWFSVNGDQVTIAYADNR